MTQAPGVLSLVRRWAVDWLNSHDPSACRDLLADNYRLTIGSVVLSGRDEYVEATRGQLANFPGLGLTIHDVVVGAEHAAVRFTEHGAAVHREGRRAAWGGIAVFAVGTDRITECWAEEDYLSRSSQLAGGACATIEPPHPAPWDEDALPADPATREAVDAWLAAPSYDHVAVDDRSGVPDDHGEGVPIEPEVLFTAGPTAAFHGRLDVGGYPLGVAGILRLDAERRVTGHLVTDRSGLTSWRRKQAS